MTEGSGQDLILIGLDCKKQAADSLSIILAHLYGFGRKKSHFKCEDHYI